MNFTAIRIGVCLVLVLGAVYAGHLHDYHSDDSGHELEHHDGYYHVATDHVAEPVVSYISKVYKTVTYTKQPVYTISYKPVVIDHGYSHPSVKPFRIHIGFHHGHHYH